MLFPPPQYPNLFSLIYWNKSKSAPTMAKPMFFSVSPNQFCLFFFVCLAGVPSFIAMCLNIFYLVMSALSCIRSNHF